MKRFTAIVLILILCMGLPALAEETRADALRVGVLEPLSGQHGSGGQAELLGVRYAHSLRPTVKVGGKDLQVELLVEDNHSNREQSTAAAYRLVDAGAQAVLGSFSSALTLAAAPVFDINTIPAIAISATNVNVTAASEYYFRMGMVDTLQGGLLAGFAREQGYNTAVVVAEADDDFAQDVGGYFQDAFEEAGGDISLWLNYDMALPDDMTEEIPAEEGARLADALTVDFEEVIKAIDAVKPDVVFIPSSAKAGSIFLKQAKDAGLAAKVISADTWDDLAILDGAGDAANGVAFTTFLAVNPEWSEQAGAFADDYRAYLTAEGMPEAMLTASAALAFDAYNALLDAVEKADSVDGPAVREALYQLDLQGVAGPVRFDEDGNNAVDTAAVMTYQDGAIQFVKKLP